MQAAVRGAVEVRVASQGVKAKWVRIELRKVETLPGGGVGNTFYDLVGSNPLDLWTATGEYEMLHTQDFPFSIRLPESIPPSVALKDQAGIHYELVASVCTLEKKGFFRRKKSRVQTQTAVVIIDKHELHSAWPVYCQHETRKQTHEGLTLIADRDSTCYGPGDLIRITATLKSEKLSTVICRAFELTLNETTIFRGLLTGKKSSAPVVKTVTISEYKHTVNATLFGGTKQTAELVCKLAAAHATTTLNAARHIDITYVLTVKANVSPGGTVSIDLPVIITNWQRHVSLEAIRRIGPAPTLTLKPVNVPLGHQTMRVEHAPKVSTLPIQRPPVSVTSSPQSNTLPLGRADDIGYGAGLGFGVRPAHRPSASNASSNGPDEFGVRPSTSTSLTSMTGRRPSSSKFTITNLPAESPPPQQQPHAPRSGTARELWPTAEDEKEQLYEAARAKVEKTQGSVARVNTPPPAIQTQNETPTRLASPQPRNPPWPTSDQEKLRLFNEALAAAKKTHGADSYSLNSSLHGRSNSDVSRTPEISRLPSASVSKAVPVVTPMLDRNQTKPISPADLYAQAISARNESLSKQEALPIPKSTSRVVVPQYRTAEQEKAALRRYEEAKMAVERVQNSGYADESGRFDSGGGSGSGAPPKEPSNHSLRGTNDLPPPFDMSTKANPNVILALHIGEKERVRREYERQDAEQKRLQRHDTLPPSFSESQSQSQSTGGSQASPQPLVPLNGSLRTKSSSSSNIASQSARRPTPTPPSVPSTSRVLTAAEEKAMLKARFAAEETRRARDVSPRQVNGNGPNHSISNIDHSPQRPGTGQSQPQSIRSYSKSYSPTPEPPSSPPPPLMPRPPVEYIQETQEEDARVSKVVMNGVLPPDEDITRSTSLSLNLNPTAPVYLPLPLSASPLEVRPFSPFSATFEQSSGMPLPGPPPPLPPKPVGD